MTGNQDRRHKHRRFTDRRVHLLLRLHEILFEIADEEVRDAALIEEVRLDFDSDRAALVMAGSDDRGGVELAALAGSWNGVPRGSRLEGEGLANLLGAHRLASGAVSLTYTRRPSVFSAAGWERLWAGDLGAEATALLSVPFRPRRADRGLLWLQQASYSREWSSQDRELAEEIASLLSRAADKVRGGE